MLNTYRVCCGQLADPRFYGGLSIATDGKGFMTCWGEGNKTRCASIPTNGGTIAQSTLLSGDGIIQGPHVVPAPSGWVVFYGAHSVLAIDASTHSIGFPNTMIPATLAAATTSGFAVGSPEKNTVQRLDRAFQPVGPAIDVAGRDPSAAARLTSIAATDDALSLLQGVVALRIDPQNQIVATPLDVSSIASLVATADGVAIAGATFENLVKFRRLDAASHVTVSRTVGCATDDSAPAIAKSGERFIVATLDPDGARSVFYAKAYRAIHVFAVDP